MPAAASAHARLVGSKPADGAVLASPPADVRLLFDDQIRPPGGDLAVDAHGRSVLGDAAHRLAGNDRVLVVPLRPGLANGDYTVRWRVVSNDGHLISGVIAFAVGAGSARPVPTLSAGGGLSAAAVLLRLFLLAGVLVAGGAALTGRFLGVGSRLQALVVGAALALVVAGGFGLLALEPAAHATRFGRVTEAAAIAGAAGVAAALGSLALPALGLAASAIGVAVLAAPTLSGHSLDPRRLRGLIALADFAHLAAAGIWTGGLLLLALSGSSRARRRFPPLALGALVVLGLGAIPRAIAAFPSLASVVDTGYGRAMLVKTGVLVVVLGLAWANRRRSARLGFAAELLLLAGVVAAVAVLTDLRPPVRGAAAAVIVPAPPGPPPADAVVLAAEDDDVAIGLAASPLGSRIAARVTALGPEGKGVDGLAVAVAGTAAEPCGPGCYAARIPLPVPPRRVPVRVGGRTLVFTLPARWPAPPAGALVARVDRVFRDLRTLVIHERLASSSHNAITTTYRVQAPNRLAYRIVDGPQAVIIGGTRWDRLPGGRWERSELEPLTEPEPFWGSDPMRNARLLSRGRVLITSFYDPSLPAWFELTIDPRSDRLLALKMTAAAHFMRHRYSGFDRPLRIVPPRSTQP